MDYRNKLLKPAQTPPMAAVVDGDTYYFKRLSTLDAIAFSRYQRTEPDPVEASVKLLILCLCDESGARVLKDEDWDALMQQDAFKLLKLGGEAAHANGFGVDKGEDAEKN